MLDDLLFQRELTPTLVLDVLGDHQGAGNGLSARDLVRKVCGISTAAGERQLRHVIEALRVAGHRIGAHPSTGYFLAATDEELESTCEFLYARAMTSLQQVAAMKRASARLGFLLLGDLALEVEHARGELAVLRLEQEGVEAAAVVDRLQRVGRDARAHRAPERIRAQRDIDQVRHEAPLGLDVGVAHFVTDQRALAGQLATPGHD